ncbi:hypothetical protein SAMN05877838_2689 [Hoeflea halophila]|uniref:Uracil DNA glycosylase superfamily protein n=1 Tax=Hoeflea halophila TaxID=714899 RepID=A0A286IDR0_9HYPH|nr:hypothetical protein [Hoeflea halophila]SOE17786.1 hypothetical protein SAMN05877838_2689 [Hoeflea halophila]
MRTLDVDIRFNMDGWPRIAETQSKLFAVDALVEISNQLREEFHSGHYKDRKMPEIAQADWKTDLLLRYDDREIGYDLPCLLSADRPTKGRIMLCAQDPLRKGTSPRVTVGTFFGIDNNRYRHGQKHYGAIWNLIRFCVHAGYDVLVTDALKIFAGKHQLRNDAALERLCLDVLRDEIDASSPDKILTMGQTAGHALSSVKSESSLLRAPHPTAWGKWYRVGSVNEKEGLLVGLENYYRRALFGPGVAQAVAGP